MMPRRRSRFTLIIAVFIIFVLYHFIPHSDWDPTAYTLAPQPNPQAPSTQDTLNTGTSSREAAGHDGGHQQKPNEMSEGDKTSNPLPDHLPDLRDENPSADFSLPTKPEADEHNASEPKKEDMLVAVEVVSRKPEADPQPKPTPKAEPTPPTPPTPPSKPANVKGLEDEEIRAQNPPGRMPDVSNHHHSVDYSGQTHWKKQPEHFPVPKESIIPLPTGTPKTFPKIQHEFAAESPAAKELRLRRLELVKTEAVRAWTGYRKYAWTHDELTPVSMSSRDPFCGWAATLVDSLDTLWIMGLKDEFDEAAKATADIDFTYSSQRHDIPVFETIIRYLGGLLAAYDVSGGPQGKYKVLLDKAVELAEILMGVFDTPNRMPILYYNWQPDYVSQPHRAGTGSIAEIATMSMEFTRLAQLTGEDRYYDAIARITNALEDLQRRGTSIPGIFPENLDMSGCNKTAAREIKLSLQAQEQAKKETPQDPQGYNPSQTAVTSHPEGEEPLPRGEAFEPAEGPSVVGRRAVMVGENGQPLSEVNDAETLPHMSLPGSFGRDAGPLAADGSHADPECIPQGIAPAYGYDQYSMGGSQDSAYEYFPKEDLMLGGLVSSYKKMHIDTVDAVKKWLLYRPMIPDDRNVLFSAKVTTSGDPAKDARYEHEVTHLTCFLGGMFALGGKIYERPEDVEVGKKLTDGCVWAYESMPAGVMPEGSTVVPCASQESCPYNETVWWEHLDPQGWYRTKNINIWEAKQIEKQQAREEKIKAQQEALRVAGEEGITPTQDAEGQAETKEMFKDEVEARAETAEHDDGSIAVEGASRLGKRMPPHVLDEKAEPPSADPAPNGGAQSQVPIKEPTKDPLKEPVKDDVLDLPDPKPMSHEEFVQRRIENERIPPGFVSINHRHYILRPEAIESVWYMYRITGDPIWQEKGWRMFEAIVKATRTDVGHSAIDNVLTDTPTQTDSMESFWLAETLKYFYLLYAEPDVISLDDWVLNTEAHPFRRPV